MTASTQDPGEAAADPRRRVPVAVWLLVAAQLLLALGWTQLAAPWRAPDEPHHHDLVRAVRAEQGWVDADRALSQQITATFDEVAFRYGSVRQLPALAAADAPEPSERRPFRELADDEPSLAGNWLGQHPPLHYVATAGALIVGESLAPASPPDYLAELAGARAASAAMIAPLPLLAFLAARRLGARDAAAAGAAGLTLAVPQLAHIGGAVNNDNLLILLLSAATVPLLAMATGDARLRLGAAAGALLGAGLLTKGFALVGLGLLPVAAIAGWLRRRGDLAVGGGSTLLPAAAQALVGLGVMAAVGGWWLVRNVAVHGTPLPHNYDPAPLEGAEPSLGAWLIEVAPRYIDRFWGSFGWFQVTIPLPVALAATLAVAALVVVAVVRRRRDLAGLAALATALAPAGAIAAAVMWRAWSLHAEYGYYPMVHGRYMLPGLVGVLAVAAVAVDGRRVHRWWPPAVAAAGVAMTVLGVAVAADAFWAGGARDELAAIAAWSPWPGWLAAAWLAASAAVVAALAAALARGVGTAPWDADGPTRQPQAAAVPPTDRPPRSAPPVRTRS